MLQTVSSKCDWAEITHELGERFEISFNTYKPFTCGIVIQPGIVTRADVVALRRKVVATVYDAIFETSADVTAVLKTGQRVHVFVKNAIGSLENPLTDAMLEAKFHGMCDAVIGASRCGALIDAAWGLGAAADVEALVGLAAGE